MHINITFEESLWKGNHSNLLINIWIPFQYFRNPSTIDLKFILELYKHSLNYYQAGNRLFTSWSCSLFNFRDFISMDFPSECNQK